jgi:hypothetical protein
MNSSPYYDGLTFAAQIYGNLFIIAIPCSRHFSDRVRDTKVTKRLIRDDLLFLRQAPHKLFSRFVCRSTGSVPKRWITRRAAEIAALVRDDLDKLRMGDVKPSQGDTRVLLTAM